MFVVYDHHHGYQIKMLKTDYDEEYITTVQQMST